MELRVLQKKASLKRKIPEIRKGLDMLKYLEEKKDSDIALTYQLADAVSARATVRGASKVGIWLGADVMVEYPVQEAQELLQGNLDVARKQLVEADSDLDFLRDQITTTEVNLARIYNHDVLKRRQAEGK